MNPGPDDPPHLLVIEHIDFENADETLWYVECPYPTVEIWFADDNPSWDPLKPEKEPVLEEDEPFAWTYWNPQSERHLIRVHPELHYCTAGGYSEQSRPTMSLISRWTPATNGHFEKCATILINERAWIPGCCYYDEVIGNVGLMDALGANYDWVSWPAELPQQEGEYPVFYWSDGWGEGFCDGLTFDRVEATV